MIWMYIVICGQPTQKNMIQLDPDQIHTPGIYVHRLVLNTSPEKRIEQRTLTAKA